MATKQALFEGIDNLVELLNTSRTKQASTPSDPGGYQGGSSHPTAKDVDNHGQSPSEGSRSSENASDVKKEIGGQSVDSTGELGADVQDKQQPNIGTQQAATGEDASVEDDYKAGKEDPGSSHPARTDNDSLDGCKYASASFSQLHTLHDSLANSILADIANFGEQLIPEKTAGAKAKPAGQATKTAAAKPADTSADLLAGYELAAMLGAEKTAAQQQVTATLEACLNDALLDADLLGSAIQTFRQKRAAAADGGESEDHDKPGDASTGASDADAGAEADAAIGSGGPPGAGGPPGGGAPGGDAPLGGGGLGDALGGGADPGGMAGGAPGGGMGKEEALMQLVAALDELGIPIEELAAMGGGAGGAGGGMPPGGMPPGADPGMGGGMPPDPGMGGGGMPPGGGAPPMPEGMKLASVAKSFRRSGKYQFKTAENGTRERAIRDYMKNYVRELAGA